MVFRTKKLFLLIILVLLQSCSGGRIGNFLESTFKNIEEPKIKEETRNNLKNKIARTSNVNVEKNKNIEEPKLKEEIRDNLKNKIVNYNEEKFKNTKKSTKKSTKKDLSRQKRNYQPQSYKIIFILREVDPKDPIKNLSTILRNSDVNFEIERIERFFDTKNKSIKKD